MTLTELHFPLSAGRHFYGVQFMTSLRFNLHPVLTRYDITHNSINSYAQETTACQLSVFNWNASVTGHINLRI